MEGQDAEKKQYHITIQETISSLRNALDRLQDLKDEIEGAPIKPMVENTKATSKPAYQPLAVTLKETAQELGECIDRLEGLRIDIRALLF